MKNLEKHISYYIGEENVELFFKNFKETLSKEEKKNELKSINLELRGIEKEPTGISLEIKSFQKDELLSSIITEENQYLNESKWFLTIGTLFSSKANVEKGKSFLNQWIENFCNNLPPSIKVKHAIRTKGIVCNLDLMVDQDIITEIIQNFGIDFCPIKFRTSIKTEFIPPDFFDLSMRKIVEKLFQFLIELEIEAKNTLSVSNAMKAGLRSIKNEKYKEDLKLFLFIANYITSFSNTKCCLKLSPKHLNTNLFKTLDKRDKEKGNLVSELKRFIDSFPFKTVIVEILNILNLDEISIIVGNITLQNGIRLTLKLPRLTQTFKMNILS